MIHKIKTVTYEVRSHSFVTTLSEQGKVVEQPRVYNWEKAFSVKQLIQHLEDVLTAIARLEKKAKKEKEREGRMK